MEPRTSSGQTLARNADVKDDLLHCSRRGKLNVRSGQPRPNTSAKMGADVESVRGARIPVSSCERQQDAVRRVLSLPAGFSLIDAKA